MLNAVSHTIAFLLSSLCCSGTWRGQKGIKNPSSFCGENIGQCLLAEVDVLFCLGAMSSSQSCSS